MTMETIADMAWALGYQISVRIFDPLTEGKNAFLHYPLPMSQTESSASVSGGSAIDKKEADQGDLIVIVSTSQSKTIRWGDQLLEKAL